MALGDFGGGVVAGIQGAQAFAQQRRDNQFRRDQLDLQTRQLELSADELQLSREKQQENVRQFNETLKRTDRGLAVDERNADTSRMNAETDQGRLKVQQGELAIKQAQEGRDATEFGREQFIELSGDLFVQAGKYGLVSPADATKLDEDVLAGQLQTGDRNATALSLRVLNEGTLPKPKGFTYTEIRKGPNGGLSVIGRYEDGSMGVLTAEGSVEKTDKVLILDPKQAAKAVSNEWLNFRVLDGAKGRAGAEYMAMRGVNQADINARSRAADEQATVVTTIDAQGNPAASRSFRTVLALAETDEERQQLVRQTAIDLGIAIPEPTAPEQVPESPKSSGYRELDTTLSNSIVPLPGGVKENTLARYEGRLETELERLKNREISGNRPDRVSARNRRDKRIGEIEAELAQIKGEEVAPAEAPKTPVMDTEAWGQFEETVIQRVDGMSDQEIDAAVDSGELTLTVDQVNVMGQRMQEAGVRSIADIAKLPTNEQLAARVLLAVVAPDENARERAREGMSNLKETGTTSYSRAALDEAETDRRKADANVLNAQASLQNAQTNWARYVKGIDSDGRSRLGRAGEKAGQVFDSMVARFRPDPERPEKLTKNYRSALAGFSQDLRKIIATKAEFKGDAEATEIIDGAINAGISEAVAVFVDNGPSASWTASLKSFFLDSPNAQGTDFSLSRVRVNDPQNPTELIYLSYATDAQGNRTGEQQGARIKISDLEKVSKAIADYATTTAIANTANAQ
jgi:hypothetical protein